jgi:hypothetical protein
MHPTSPPGVQARVEVLGLSSSAKSAPPSFVGDAGGGVAVLDDDAADADDAARLDAGVVERGLVGVDALRASAATCPGSTW